MQKGEQSIRIARPFVVCQVCRCRGQQPHVFRSKFGHNNKPLLPAAWTNYLRERSRTYDLQGMSSSLVKANFEGKTLLAS